MLLLGLLVPHAITLVTLAQGPEKPNVSLAAQEVFVEALQLMTESLLQENANALHLLSILLANV